MKIEVLVLRARPRVKVRVTRDSVCTADDGDAPHETLVDIPSFVDPGILSKHLASGYLPTVAGAGHAWECLLNGVIVGTVSTRGFEPRVREVSYSDENHFHFRYCSAPC